MHIVQKDGIITITGWEKCMKSVVEWKYLGTN